jgi:hypothetical protein
MYIISAFGDKPFRKLEHFTVQANIAAAIFRVKVCVNLRSGRIDLAVGDKWEVKNVIGRADELYPIGNDHVIEGKRR